MPEAEPNEVIVCQNGTCMLRYYDRYKKLVEEGLLPESQWSGNLVEDMTKVAEAEGCPLKILTQICFDDCFRGPNVSVNGRLHRPAIYPENLFEFIRSLKSK